jgi:hypothetical protein
MPVSLNTLYKAMLYLNYSTISMYCTEDSEAPS